MRTDSKHRFMRAASYDVRYFRTDAICIRPDRSVPIGRVGDQCGFDLQRASSSREVNPDVRAKGSSQHVRTLRLSTFDVPVHNSVPYT